jgi:hypothetical protein
MESARFREKSMPSAIDFVILAAVVAGCAYAFHKVFPPE